MEGIMRRGLVGALVASAALLAVPALAQEYHYVRVATIDLPTPTGHGDWVAYDPSNKMIYVSLKDDGMAVIDTRTNTVAHVIKPIEDPNVMAWDDNYVYETAAEGLPQGMNGGPAGTGFGTRNQIVVIDKHTWQVVDRVEMWDGSLNVFGNRGTTPDAIGVANGRIYVDMDDNNVMDVFTTGAHPQFVAQWPLEPRNTNSWWLNTTDYTGPDAFAFSPDGHWIYQTVNTYIEKIDASTGAISNVVDLHTGLTSKGGTKTPAVDPKTGNVWLSTTSTKLGVFVLNPNTLQPIKNIPDAGPGSGSDESALDPGLGLFYTFATGCKGVPNKGGCFTVFDTNKMERVTTVGTNVHLTHSGTVDPDTHDVYAYEGSRARIGVYRPVRGPGPNGGWARFESASR
jgi:sugar lactone lactonase YvrE